MANKHYEALKAQFPETFEKCFFHISEKREMTKKQEAYYKGILPSNIQFFVYASVFYESKFRCGIYDEGSFSISISIKKFLSMNYVELQDYYRLKGESIMAQMSYEEFMKFNQKPEKQEFQKTPKNYVRYF